MHTETVVTSGGGRGGSRDRELLGFIGRHGIVTVGQVEAAMQVGRTASYRRIAACEEMGLLERLALIRSEPPVLRATRDGLDYAGLGLPVAQVSPGQVAHQLRCVDVAIGLARRYGAGRLLTERELIWLEQVEGKPIASVPVSKDRHRSGQRMHRADLLVQTDRGSLAFEVELTAKAPSRLAGIMRAWRLALIRGELAEVHYLCAAGRTLRAVQRAAERARAPERIVIAELNA